MNESSDSKNKVCLTCGQALSGLASLMMVSPTAGASLLCARCAAEEHARSFVSLEEADCYIEEATGMVESLERIIAKCSEMPKIPAGLEAGAMTPLSVYRTMQIHLAAYKSRRMEMLAEAGSRARAEYEIKKAIDAKDFELAAELKKRYEV